MGVSISSKNVFLDMGYMEFERLRQTVARLCPKEIADHYLALLELHRELMGKECKEAWQAYDERTEELYENNKKYQKVMEFLYASDCSAKMTYGCAKQLLQTIGDYDDDIIYGYGGREHPAKFCDFKRMLQDAYETKKGFQWC